MKLFVVLLLVGIVTVSCLPKKGSGGGKGKRGKWCKENDGVDWDEGCECQDGSTCDSYKDCKKETCGKKNGNPVVSCTCLDGEEWTKPEEPETPCDVGRRWSKDVKSCICDGETYEGRALKRNCGRKGENAEECTCSDGSTWTPSEEDDEEED